MLAVGGRVLPHFEDSYVCMSTGFGGGVGGSHEELCGAFSAGVMIIGGLTGRSKVEEDSERCYALVSEYRRRFHARWKTLTCNPIRDWAKGPQGPAGGCAYVVAQSALVLLDLLESV
jgi:C_GCAxxG_C_C family probable redox protein